MAERGEIKAKISRINEFGLCEVTVSGNPRRRAGFTLDKLDGYSGQPLREFGIRAGAKVIFIEDARGRVKSARLVHATAAS